MMLRERAELYWVPLAAGLKEDLGGSGVSGSEEQERGSGARRRKAMKANTARASLLSVGQLPRQRGEADTPTSNQLPRGAQGRRLLGPAALRTCPLALLLSQVRACLGPGGYCRCSGNGGPQTCLPAACGVAQRGAQRGSSSSTRAQDPREGPSLAGRTTRSFLRRSLFRLAREEAERSRWGTSRVGRDASHDDRSQAGARRV